MVVSDQKTYERQLSPLYGCIDGDTMPHFKTIVSQSGMTAISAWNSLLSMRLGKLMVIAH